MTNDGTPDVLQRLRNELESLREAMLDDHIRSDEVARQHRRDIAGILAILKSVAGDFDEEVGAVEEHLIARERAGS